jgi:hypothetical protein
MRNAEGPWDFDATADHRSAQVIQIESSKLLPTLILVAMLAVAGIIAAAVAWGAAREAKTEARLASYYMLELDHRVTAAGIQKPDESITARMSAGNQ